MILAPYEQHYTHEAIEEPRIVPEHYSADDRLIPHTREYVHDFSHTDSHSLTEEDERRAFYEDFDGELRAAHSDEEVFNSKFSRL